MPLMGEKSTLPIKHLHLQTTYLGLEALTLDAEPMETQEKP